MEISGYLIQLSVRICNNIVIFVGLTAVGGEIYR